jgi:hypothetical protein
LWNQGALYLQPLKRLFSNSYSEPNYALLALSAMIVWPWASAATFLVLRTSMRVARLRLVHVLRVLIYSFDAAMWPGVIALAVSLALSITAQFTAGLSRFDENHTIAGSCLAAMVVVASVRVHAACRLYLRLPHAAGVVLASQVMALLVVAAVLSILPLTSGPLLELWNDLSRAMRRP